MTRVQTTRDAGRTRLAGIEEALLHRMDQTAPLTDNGRQYRGMTLIELSRQVLETSGHSTRGMSRMEVATAALTVRAAGMMTGGDLPSLLASVANKRMRASYSENPGTYRAWARRAPDAVDFKPLSVVNLSALPDLLQVNEAGEFKYGQMSNSAESYRLLSYGRLITLSRQALVNDDLRGFDRAVTGFGAAAARLENRTAYAQLTGNANLSDGVALFHASHANLGTGPESALSLASLAAMRAAMRVQRGLQLEELNITPAYLIVPAALEQTAYQFTSSQFVPAAPGSINEFRSGGRTALVPVVDPVLDAASPLTWYGAAAGALVDTIEYCFLNGSDGPAIDMQPGFEQDGLSIRCRHDFAAKAIDFRGLYRANGS
ncbi:MAG: hypothetical protein RIQ60_3594 [Pseudomonadota bacterium]|jgi:hypothetical protein